MPAEISVGLPFAENEHGYRRRDPLSGKAVWFFRTRFARHAGFGFKDRIPLLGTSVRFGSGGSAALGSLPREYERVGKG